MSKVIRALIVGDLHNDNRQPPTRRDDYMSACLSELRECMEVAKKHVVDYVLFLGDIFHRMEPSGACRNQVIKILQRDDEGQPYQFRKLVVVGNHDVKNSLDNLKSSALGTLIRTKCLEYGDFFEEYGLALGHYRESIHEEMRNGLLMSQPAQIWAVHAYVVPGQFHASDYAIFDEIPMPEECQLLLAGHLHMPMEIQRADGKKLINPGSVGRPKASAEHLDRQPKVMLMKYELGGDVQTRYVELKSPMPADDVFYLEEARARASSRKAGKEFVKQVNSLSSWTQGEDKYDSVRTSGKHKGVSEEVVELAVTTLKEINENRFRSDD